MKGSALIASCRVFLCCCFLSTLSRFHGSFFFLFVGATCRGLCFSQRPELPAQYLDQSISVSDGDYTGAVGRAVKELLTRVTFAGTTRRQRAVRRLRERAFSSESIRSLRGDRICRGVQRGSRNVSDERAAQDRSGESVISRSD